jgi:hypothetical protein
MIELSEKYHYLTVREVAQLLNVVPATVRGYCRKGLLPGSVRAHYWLIPDKAVEHFKTWLIDGQPDGGPRQLEDDQR